MDSFESELVKNMKVLKAYCIKKFHDVEGDIFQETLTRALYCRDKYNGKDKLITWLCGIALNVWRTDNRYKTEKQSKTLNIDDCCQQSLPYCELFESYDLDYINSHINSIKNYYKVPFILHSEGYKLAEIAEHMNISKKSAKTRSSFAKRMIKTWMYKNY